MTAKMELFLFVLFYSAMSVFSKQIKQLPEAIPSESGIPVCPPGYDRAFANGTKCCQYDENFKPAKDVAPWSSNVCPSHLSADCPRGSGCEDNPPSCFEFFELQGFGPDFDGFYNFGDKNIYHGSKQVYVLYPELRVPGDKCIWWHRSCRRWWLGGCEKVGQNSGFAYIDADLACPHPEELRWKKTGQSRYLTGIKNYSAERCKYFDDGTAICGATTSTPLTSHPSGGENAFVVNDLYLESCSWRYSTGNWSCIKENTFLENSKC